MIVKQNIKIGSLIDSTHLGSDRIAFSTLIYCTSLRANRYYPAGALSVFNALSVLQMSLIPFKGALLRKNKENHIISHISQNVTVFI